MPYHIWMLVTNLGDASVVLPLAVLLTLTLMLFESTQAAWVFMRALLGCIAGLVVLKAAFISCAQAWNPQLESPSGHSALSILVYGALAGLIMRSRSGSAGPDAAVPADMALPGASGAAPATDLLATPGMPVLRLAASVGALLLASTVAVSRIVLHDHTPLEVVAGASLGLLALTAFLVPYGRLPAPRFPVGGFAALALLLLALTYGEISPAEQVLRRGVGFLGMYFNFCR